MPPWLTLSAIKDGVIVIAIIALSWWVYHAGENAVHVKDVKALQAQIAHMQKTQQDWEHEQANASAREQHDVSAISSGAVVHPIHVRLCINRPVVETVLPSTTTATAGNDAKARGGNLQAGQDIGPALQDYERWLETKFAQCREVIAGWPK